MENQTKPKATIYCASHRGVSPDAKRSMEVSGFPYQIIVGVSDTALARNITLSRALQAKEPTDVIVLLDDDMQVSRLEMHHLVEHALKFGEPVSAVYVTENRRVAACQIKEGESWRESRWVTGLGCLAIPRGCLQALAGESEYLETTDEQGESIWAFCQSGPGQVHPDSPRQWLSEDYSLTKRLGGCVLAPIGVGHCKMAAMAPDATTLDAVRNGGLVGKADMAPNRPGAPPTTQPAREELKHEEPVAAQPASEGKSFFCSVCGVRRWSPDGGLPAGWTRDEGESICELKHDELVGDVPKG